MSTGITSYSTFEDAMNNFTSDIGDLSGKISGFYTTKVEVSGHIDAVNTDLKKDIKDAYDNFITPMHGDLYGNESGYIPGTPVGVDNRAALPRIFGLPGAPVNGNWENDPLSLRYIINDNSGLVNNILKPMHEQIYGDATGYLPGTNPLDDDRGALPRIFGLPGLTWQTDSGSLRFIINNNSGLIQDISGYVEDTITYLENYTNDKASQQYILSTQFAEHKVQDVYDNYLIKMHDDLYGDADGYISGTNHADDDRGALPRIFGLPGIVGGWEKDPLSLRYKIKYLEDQFERIKNSTDLKPWFTNVTLSSLPDTWDPSDGWWNQGVGTEKIDNISEPSEPVVFWARSLDDDEYMEGKFARGYIDIKCIDGIHNGFTSKDLASITGFELYAFEAPNKIYNILNNAAPDDGGWIASGQQNAFKDLLTSAWIVFIAPVIGEYEIEFSIWDVVTSGGKRTDTGAEKVISTKKIIKVEL